MAKARVGSEEEPGAGAAPEDGEPEGAEPAGAEPEGAPLEGAEPEVAEPEGAEPEGALEVARPDEAGPEGVALVDGAGGDADVPPDSVAADPAGTLPAAPGEPAW